ncbi:tol-pal system-associated acyl-CoA thioesterase [Nitrosospira briensis]|uniref:Acyl-CoA thioester hydrolase n=1 Tax=Nitrosospira briensis TaxID=35799 RepID=A0A1I5EP26_9PROT|nr:tol-pal system-associated acyl-CoA thioesterase [Nitrosospira briensis]SFO12811.1 acyl-CoA thioester hydrolase [Nitrosospira briensis]SFO33969.1 acyl-CoA thioester hydrolase [Nitrosospira briensis]
MNSTEADKFAVNSDKSPFSLPVRVYYQDTDAGGVVYHSTYLDYMERARYEWLRELGFDIHSLVQVHKVVFMIRSLSIEYFRPALLDDLLHVTAQAAELGRSRIAISQHILRGTATLVSAAVQAVCVGSDSLKPVSIPLPLRQKLGNLS